MDIYKSELPIAELISKNKVLRYELEATPYKRSGSLENFAQANSVQSSDLYSVKSVLVSSVWNKNDDIFLKEEIWAARQTPRNHPCNINHDEKNIVGHIIDCWAEGVDGSLLASEEEAMNSSLFDLVCESVIYTFWRDDKKIDEVLNLIDKIEKNEMFVSMECAFEDFDYAIESDGKYNIIARTAETAFLSRKLKAFGGDGVYNSHRIGRVPRKITFTGKGFTSNPANKRSIIFDKKEENQEIVYASIASFLENGVITSIDMENKMSEELQKENSEMKAKVAEFELAVASLTEAKLALESELNSLKSALELKDKEISEKAGLLADAEVKLSASVSKVEELDKQLKDTVASHSLAMRKLTLEHNGLSKEEAESKVSLYASLNDEQWAGIAALLVKKETATSLASVIEAAEPTATVVQTEPEPVATTVDLNGLKAVAKEFLSRKKK